jgi:endonuclease III
MLPLFPHDDAERARDIFQRLNPPLIPREQTAVETYSNQPFKILIASMLSARTREEDTGVAMDRLFALADTPDKMRLLSYETVLAAIHNVTFPEPKARNVIKIAEMLIEMGGEVPRTVEELTVFPGVGWKSAVLTLWIAYHLDPEICVDVHVGRIGKRLGMVNPKTNDPQKISRELMAIVPRDIWGPWNPTMVIFGRNICYPVKPACPVCPINELCPKVGVTSTSKVLRKKPADSEVDN